ncbi:MAG: HlyD family secretion protein [Rhodobacteraceae bacterium]|nr:HlyD family secretion protein [Paracoccaceae bacterium]
MFSAVAVLAVLFGAYEGYGWWTHGRFIETTDDAYVSADIPTVLSKVSGYVQEITVADHQQVKAGDVLAKIDDTDYRLAVASASAALAVQKAVVARIGEQIAASKVSILEANASLKSAEAELESAKLTFNRQEELVKTSVVSQSSLDTARASLLSAQANVEKAKAAVQLSKVNVKVLEAQKSEAEQGVSSKQTALEQAERNLAFTTIRSPIDGTVGNRVAQVGSFLQAGSRIAAVVPMQAAYIDANFKETQLKGLEKGASVSIEVDAYPDAELHGVVSSVSPATGSVFSLLPSENATGNFTKVVQRVPVRISIAKEDVAAHPLRAGMSVVVGVDTRTSSETH